MKRRASHRVQNMMVMLLALWLSGCSIFSNEGYRTSRAYDMGNRGEETYAVASGTDSIAAAKLVNDSLTATHVERTKLLICGMVFDDPILAPIYCSRVDKRGKAETKGGDKTSKEETSTSEATDGSTKTEKPVPPNPTSQSPADISQTNSDVIKAPYKGGPAEQHQIQVPHGRPLPPTRIPYLRPAPSSEYGRSPVATGTIAPKDQTSPAKTEAKSRKEDEESKGETDKAMAVPSEMTLYDYGLGKYWPESYFSALVTANTGKSEGERLSLVREFNNLLWQQFLRDLLTEPSVHSLVPISRKVVLGCAPPPEQTVIASAMSVLAEVTGKGGIKGSLDARFTESVAKLFEQSERTIFLQYAMFRLCEMSVNSPGEFRNVFPLVIQELVRQSAALTVESEIERVRTQRVQAETLGKLASLEQDRLKCVKDQLQKNKDSKSEEIAKFCGVPYQFAPSVLVPIEPEPPSGAGS